MPRNVLYDQIPKAIETQLAAQKTAGHAIAVMESFGRDAVPRTKEGKFPYLIVSSPTTTQIAESSEATYYRVEQEITIYDRTQNNLQQYADDLIDALDPIIASPEAFSNALETGVGVTSIREPLANGRRLQDGLHAIRVLLRCEARVERQD